MDSYLELLLGSLLIFLLCCGALGIGQLFGRNPINGGCRPRDGGHCANTENCSLRCIRKTHASKHREVAP